jgi:endogenous inhibitor of DNA gyrase (YacG/DUF329 family)
MLDPDRKPLKTARKTRCPICRKPTVAATKPFCSDRCRQVDLNRWLGEHYRVPSDEPVNPDDPDLLSQSPPDLPTGRNGPGSW